MLLFLQKRDVLLTKLPLPAPFDAWEDVFPGKLVDRIRAQLKERGHLSAIEQHFFFFFHSFLFPI